MLGFFMSKMMMGNKLLLKNDWGTTKILLADSFWKRFLGLMGRKESDYGLLLSPCKSVHTSFMRYDLDILFLDRENRVLDMIRDLKPWRVTGTVKDAHSVLEIPASMQLDFIPGMALSLEPEHNDRGC